MNEEEIEDFIEDWKIKNLATMGMGIAIATTISLIIIFVVLIKEFI